MKILFNLTAILFFLSSINSAGQSITVKVIDNKTEEAIPFASIQTGEHQGVITNEEGMFSISEETLQFQKDSIYISSLGYEKKGIWVHREMDTIIRLAPKTVELDEVFLSSRNLSVKEIIERVKDNLDSNYSASLTNKQIFFRESDFTTMEKVKFDFKKSTIEEFNKELLDSIEGLIPKYATFYREVAGNFYGDYSNHKFKVEKAAELYDKAKDLSMEGIGNELERIFKENVKPNSYLKIKSGWFGTKVQLDSLVDSNEEAAEMKEDMEKKVTGSIQEQTKYKIASLYDQLIFNEDSKIDVLDKSNRYNFKLDGYTFIDGEAVYILPFEPKGSKDFKGTMYVNTEDFAIVRLDFDNVKPLRKFSLLGLSFRNNIYRGKMLFGKDATGFYSPRYIEIEDGSFFGVDRPLKVIEKNKHVKGRRKQNELALNIDMQMRQRIKYEMVVFNTEVISDEDFKAVKENPEIKATYLSAYSPDFWKDYTIIEPNEAIQSFKIVE